LLEAARRAGATAAGWQMVRLPQAVGPIFLEWLDQHYPDRRARVESRIRAMRDGQLNTSQFGDRMRGRGEHAQRTGDLFRLFARKLGLDRPLPALDATRFQIPQSGPTQQWLF
jgi:DNA repair photolyase